MSYIVFENDLDIILYNIGVNNEFSRLNKPLRVRASELFNLNERYKVIEERVSNSEWYMATPLIEDEKTGISYYINFLCDGGMSTINEEFQEWPTPVRYED